MTMEKDLEREEFEMTFTQERGDIYLPPTIRGGSHIARSKADACNDLLLYICFAAAIFLAGILVGLETAEAETPGVIYPEGIGVEVDPYQPPGPDYTWQPWDYGCVDVAPGSCLDYYRKFTYPHRPQDRLQLAQVVNEAPTLSPPVNTEDNQANDPLNFPNPNGDGVLGDSIVEKPAQDVIRTGTFIRSYLSGRELPLIYGDYWAEQLWYDQVASDCGLEGLSHYEQARDALIQERAKNAQCLGHARTLRR